MPPDTIPSPPPQPEDEARLERIEAKLDRVLSLFAGLSSDVQGSRLDLHELKATVAEHSRKIDRVPCLANDPGDNGHGLCCPEGAE